jgi:hypothetical protein
MMRLRVLLFLVGIVAVAPSLTGCVVYSRPGPRWGYTHHYYRGW